MIRAQERGIEVAKICRSKPLTGAQLSRVLELLEDGADLNVRYGPGNSALHFAAEKGHTVIVQKLLLKGADSICINDNLQTPIDLARSAGHINITKCFEAFAKISSQHLASIPVPNSPADDLVLEEAAGIYSDLPLMPVSESAYFATDSASLFSAQDSCKNNVTITTLAHESLQDHTSNVPAEQLVCQGTATSTRTSPVVLGQNKVHPEVMTFPETKGVDLPRYKIHAEAQHVPDITLVDSNRLTTFPWKHIFILLFINIAFTAAACTVMVIHFQQTLNATVQAMSNTTDQSIGQLSANQQTLNATVAQSISQLSANQQTLNATVAQSISQLSANQQTLNATVAQSISQLSANQQTLNASVQAMSNTTDQSIGQLSANQQTLNATVAQSISQLSANQQTLNATVAQSISQLSGNQQTLNSTLNALLVDGNSVCSFDSVSCGCKSGFFGRSFHCSDIDECALNTHNCMTIDFCNNTFGGFVCRMNFSKISAGMNHTCALTTSGAAKCWGDGRRGQLGNGATSNALTPVDVTGMSSGVVAISAGGSVSAGSHTCALTTSGAAKCWGDGGEGRLGNGATSNALTPVDVTGMSSGVVAISTGASHACALTTSGAAKCWGYGGSGQLGNGATISALTPVDVTGMSSGVVAISTGTSHVCVLTTSGAAKCWGSGQGGKLGNGAMIDALTPVNVTGMSSGVVAISAGQHYTCALTTSGAAKCWGYGRSGQLGNGATSDALTPVDVTGMSSGVVAISTGASHACALTTSGAAKCWGSGSNGKLGNGATSDALTPVDVTGMSSGMSSISSGSAGSHTCALTTSGAAKCWGSGIGGKLGNGAISDALTPVDVAIVFA
jgi:alpha-tubulin suppressor-like RCC1 family protein